MKNLTLKLFAVVLLFTVGGCGLSKMVKNAELVKYQVTPDPLEMHAGKVPVQITVNFPPKYFNKKAYVEFTPVLISSNGKDSTELVPGTLQGEKVEDNNQMISYDNGGSYTYLDTIPYENVYRKSDLDLMVKAYKGGNGKSLSFATVTIAHGIITTPELVDDGLKVDNGVCEGTNSGIMKTITSSIDLPKPTPASKNLTLFYPLQKDALTSKEKRKADIDSFLNTVKQITDDPDVNMQNVTVASYASPDGPQDLNHNLVEGRYKNSTDFMTGKFKKAKIDTKEDIVTRTTTPDEDWAGFQKLVQESNMEDKDVILRVLSMYSDPNVREKEIKNMSAVYDKLRKEILPKLRRAEIIATYEARQKTPEELVNLGKTNPTTLNQDELFFAGVTAVGADKETIYKTYTATYTDDWKGFNNLGAYYIKSNNLDQAELQLQKAENIDANNAAIINNMGVLYWQKGDYEKAEEYFKKAASINPSDEINYNLGVILIKQAKYDEAVQKFGATPTFNKSLAQLLAGNTQDALNTLNKVTSEDAYYFYLKAVESARNDDVNGVITNLTSAVKKDTNLKVYAANDMEFRKYFEDESFKSIIQ